MPVHMDVSVHDNWTQPAFLRWDAGREERHEFDGVRPVRIAGGTFRHSLVMANPHDALRRELQGLGCRCVGPDAGVATTNGAVRCPDALITCAAVPGAALTIPGVVAVFEIVSSSSSCNDRIVKVREYAEVATILHYVVLESTTPAMTVFARRNGEDMWLATTLMADDNLLMSTFRIDVPVRTIYADIDFDNLPGEDDAG